LLYNKTKIHTHEKPSSFQENRKSLYMNLLFVNLAGSRELATVLEVLKDNSLSHSRQKKKKKKRKKYAKMAATKEYKISGKLPRRQQRASVRLYGKHGCCCRSSQDSNSGPHVVHSVYVLTTYLHSLARYVSLGY
jgi:hypothetical protein